MFSLLLPLLTHFFSNQLTSNKMIKKAKMGNRFVPTSYQAKLFGYHRETRIYSIVLEAYNYTMWYSGVLIHHYYFDLLYITNLQFLNKYTLFLGFI
jgi:hypothetical protein